MHTINTAITKTLKRQRQDESIAPIHASIAPVKAYAEYITGKKKEPHHVVTIPEGTAAYGMGYRFVSIPFDELQYYLANGASLAL